MRDSIPSERNERMAECGERLVALISPANGDDRCSMNLNVRAKRSVESPATIFLNVHIQREVEIRSLSSDALLLTLAEPKRPTHIPRTQIVFDRPRKRSKLRRTS